MATIHRLITVCRQAVLRQALAVVANSRGLADLSRRADPVPVRVIPNGIEVDLFRPPDAPPSSPERPFAFIFAGRFQSQKNLFFLMDRLKELQEVASRPFIVHMVGDGPLKADLKRYAARLGLQNCLIWHGWVGKEALRTLYQSADCCVNPALTEGMPNTVLEAMASGLPVVASQVPGNLDLVKPGETGFLVSLNNALEFTLALKTILDHPELGQYLGKAGRELVVRDFSWKEVAKAYLNLFRDKGR
jgi:glycosyltransferase involved in cell wall biosynthesis